MILFVESVYGDTMLHGNRFEGKELRQAVKQLLNVVSEEEFVSAFCMRYQYSVVPYDPNAKADYVIDLDTHWVYKPIY